MYNQYKDGWLEVISGCMFAGKTEELIRRIHVLSFAKKDIKVFKPALDTRYSIKEIVTHSGTSVPCISVKCAKDILKHIDNKTDIVAIDEIQFFDIDIVDICEYLANQGKRVIVAGLDQDFRGEPFEVISQLLPRAEFVTKLTAVCAKCGSPATRTQRIVDHHPASYDDPVVLVGASEHYEPRCRHCHEILSKPKKFD